jgi:hypothetical protein
MRKLVLVNDPIAVGIEFLEPCKNVLIFQRFAHEQESPSDFLAANAMYA